MSPFWCGLVGDVFLDVGEHAEGGSFFVSSCVDVHFCFPLHFWEAVEEEFFVLGGVLAGFEFFVGLAAPFIEQDEFLGDAFGPCAAE